MTIIVVYVYLIIIIIIVIIKNVHYRCKIFCREGGFASEEV